MDSSYIPLIISNALSLFVAILSHRINKRMQERDEKERQEAIIREEAVQKRQMEHDALIAGLRAILRDRLINAYRTYGEWEEIPLYVSENIQKMYMAYHNVGGNDTVTKLYEILMDKPCIGGEHN